MALLSDLCEYLYEYRLCTPAIERFDYKGIERNYLLGCGSLEALSRAPSTGSCLLVVLLSNLLLTLLQKYQWFANGLTLQVVCSLVLVCNLAHYLPMRRHLHYLTYGFGLIAMLTVLLQQFKSVSAAISSMLGTDALQNQKELWLLSQTTSNLYL